MGRTYRFASSLGHGGLLMATLLWLRLVPASWYPPQEECSSRWWKNGLPPLKILTMRYCESIRIAGSAPKCPVEKKIVIKWNTPPDIGSHRDMTRFGRGRCHCVKEVYRAVHDFYLYLREGILALEGLWLPPQRPVMVISAQSAVSMSVWVC